MSSKYDRVKVKVHLGGDHYYILSRFMLSKMLTFCKLPTTAAVRVSLELKKFLVDQGKLHVTQAELEAATFYTMAQYGFGEAHTRLFPLMTRFYMERVPLLILIAGSGCCSKTFIAHSLASKLNTHNVVSTDLLLDVLTAVHAGFPADSIAPAAIPNNNLNSDDVDHHLSIGAWPQPDERGLWFRTDNSNNNNKSYNTNSTNMNNDDPSGLLSLPRVWQAWASAVRPLVTGELDKAAAEGKVLIVEGSLLDLAHYRNYLSRHYQRRYGAIAVAFYVSADDASRQFVAERFVTSHTEMLPTFYRENSAADLHHHHYYNCSDNDGDDYDSENSSVTTVAAVEWMMRRLKAVESTQLQIIAEKSNRMALRSMDEGWRSRLSKATTSGNSNTITNNNNIDSTGGDEGEEEIVYVNAVSYSVGALTKPHEFMQELVLERIMVELHHRQLVQEAQSQTTNEQALNA
ncbi:hypothetical protein LSM04_004855 [Trypanosoma melophagium]|uniref:uncharacterized protein n=1 Tax=Trypanosoma melophagium TaxID=715481 RepID=UPI00351A2B67|nr:hypothetical protein LSM04_004855 [Trypanosoma melophagium]